MPNTHIDIFSIWSRVGYAIFPQHVELNVVWIQKETSWGELCAQRLVGSFRDWRLSKKGPWPQQSEKWDWNRADKRSADKQCLKEMKKKLWLSGLVNYGLLCNPSPPLMKSFGCQVCGFALGSGKLTFRTFGPLHQCYLKAGLLINPLSSLLFFLWKW